MVEADPGASRPRRTGAIKRVRDGVWRVDTELPRVDGAPRRRVSKTVIGTMADAEAALAELQAKVATGDQPIRPAARSRRRQRPKRSGSLTMLGTDRWLVGVEGERDPVTGQRRRHTQVVLGSREQAEVALARLKVTGDGDLLRVGTRARTVRAACELYLSEASTELQTQRQDRTASNRICATVLPGGASFGEVPLSKVTWKLVEQLFVKWEEDLQPATRARYASTLSKVLDHAKRTGWMAGNPVREARRPKVPAHRPEVPKASEVRAALRAAKAQDPMLHAYVLGLATMGCRRSELLALTIDDLDLAGGVATIRASLADGGRGVGIYRKATKRDDWRDVPLTEQMVEVLTELLEVRRELLRDLDRDGIAPGSYVFSDDPAGRTWLRPDTTTQRWLEARGDSPVTFAMLRRYVATELLDVTNGDYRLVASITGNSEETLRRWYDAGPNMDKKRAVVGMTRL
jgi:integrase